LLFRSVYEGNDHQKFLERLDSRIKQYDRDIERMCNFHYQGFIESITELINVRNDVERLKVCAMDLIIIHWDNLVPWFSPWKLEKLLVYQC